jgi:hypothetical protein
VNEQPLFAVSNADVPDTVAISCFTTVHFALLYRVSNLSNGITSHLTCFLSLFPKNEDQNMR